ERRGWALSWSCRSRRHPAFLLEGAGVRPGLLGPRVVGAGEAPGGVDDGGELLAQRLEEDVERELVRQHGVVQALAGTVEGEAGGPLRPGGRRVRRDVPADEL